MIQEKEIVYCNAKCKYKGKVYQLKEIVYKHTDGWYWNHLELLKKRNINEKVMIYDIEIISRLGFENQSQEFTEVKANDNNKRNRITGAYE